MKITRLKYKDLISPYKWKAFLVGYYIADIKRFIYIIYHLLEYPILKILGEKTEVPISEVDRAFYIVYRHLQCSDCMQRGFCDGCGCTTPANILPANNYCHKGKWFGMLPDFQKFARDNHFELKIFQKPRKKIQDISEEDFNKLFN